MVIKCIRTYATTDSQGTLPHYTCLQETNQSGHTVFVFNGTTEWKQKDYYSQMVIYTSLEEIWYNENNRNLSFMAFDSHTQTTCADTYDCVYVHIYVCMFKCVFLFLLKLVLNNLYKTFCSFPKSVLSAILPISNYLF